MLTDWLDSLKQSKRTQLLAAVIVAVAGAVQQDFLQSDNALLVGLAGAIAWILGDSMRPTNPSKVVH